MEVRQGIQVKLLTVTFSAGLTAAWTRSRRLTSEVTLKKRSAEGAQLGWQPRSPDGAKQRPQAPVLPHSRPSHGATGEGQHCSVTRPGQPPHKPRHHGNQAGQSERSVLKGSLMN